MIMNLLLLLPFYFSSTSCFNRDLISCISHFRLLIFPPLELVKTGDRQADVAANMAQVNAILEQWIRDTPEQWLWLHNRWPD